MSRPRSSVPGVRLHSLCKPRRVRFEGLERRLAMAVDCNVTCELSNDQLTVVGSEDDDLIEIRYDESTRSVQVLGDGQLLGLYAADSIGSLVVQGLAGNDQLCVDSNLPLACYVDGGEGEDQLQLFSPLTMPTSHGHGGAASRSIFERNIEAVTSEIIVGERSSVTSGSGLGDRGTADRTATGETGEASEGEFSPNPLSAPRLPLMYVAPTLTEHNTHGTNADLAADDSHGGEHGGFGAAAVIATDSNHDSHVSAALAAATVIVDDAGDSLASETPEGRGTDAGAGHHGGSAAPVKGTELAKKWCTTTPLANRLITTLEGKPTCFCKEPESGEASSVWEGSNADGAANRSGGSCSPRLSAWDSILADIDAGQVCSEKTTNELAASISGVLERQRRRSSGGERLAGEEHSADIGESLDYLTWAGWGLVAAGVYLAPLLLKRLETEADREAREQADAELHQIELLNAG